MKNPKNGKTIYHRNPAYDWDELAKGKISHHPFVNIENQKFVYKNWLLKLFIKLEFWFDWENNACRAYSQNGIFTLEYFPYYKHWSLSCYFHPLSPTHIFDAEDNTKSIARMIVKYYGFKFMSFFARKL